jgi:hypothetical protein
VLSIYLGDQRAGGTPCRLNFSEPAFVGFIQSIRHNRTLGQSRDPKGSNAMRDEFLSFKAAPVKRSRPFLLQGTASAGD